MLYILKFDYSLCAFFQIPLRLLKLFPNEKYAAYRVDMKPKIIVHEILLVKAFLKQWAS